MALDAYIKIDGIEGESKDSEHQQWIQLLEFQHEIKQSATLGGGGPGSTIGRSDHGDFKIRKSLDQATPKIMLSCCSGKQIGTVSFDLMRADGNKRVKGLEITLEKVFISDVKPSGIHDTGEFPSEWVSFNYGVIKWKYTPQQRSATDAQGAITGGWNVVERKEETG